MKRKILSLVLAILMAVNPVNFVLAELSEDIVSDVVNAVDEYETKDSSAAREDIQGEDASLETSMQEDVITEIADVENEIAVGTLDEDLTEEKSSETDAKETQQAAETEDSEIILFSDDEGFSYSILNGTYCSVTGYSGTDTDIEIPAEINGHIVQSIASGAFRNNKTIENIVFPNTLESIESSAFSGCTGLTKVTIPSTVTSISNSLFGGCTGLTSITIPESVTSIGYDAFCGCTGLTSITIHESVTNIGGYAFSGCTGLTSITIPESVTNIGYFAFYGCTGLKTAGPVGGGYDYEFGWETEIPSHAFSGCTGLTSITIPESVTSIGNDAFDGCTGLKTAGPVGGGYDYEFSWETEIPSHAFSGCTGLTSITIPETVTNIGSSVFSGCTGLTSITIPETVTNIGYYAFGGCTGLKTAGPVGGGYDYEFSWETEIPSSAFSGCTGLTSITIPETVTNIGSSVFSGCTGLTSITIPESVTNIGYSAFDGCTGLTSITIPESVTNIGGYAFSGCTGLTSITIPESVTNIGYSAFDGCTGLTSITIPESVTNIGYFPFYGCTGLKTAGPVGGGYDYEFGWKSKIPSYAFYGCTGLTSITIPASVTSIGNDAFDGCTGLKTAGPVGGGYDIEFGWTESIPSDAFRECTSLTSITIPDSVTNIGYSAFDGCTGLTSITISESVTNIGGYAFSGCTGLTSITIPASVTSIGNFAFSGCTGLTSITIPESVTNIGYFAFYGCTGLKTAGPVGGGYDYEFSWETEIPSSAFSGCTGLTSITIPETVTNIGSSVFSGCTGLTSITIPASVTNIGNYAFSGCTNLQKIYWNATNVADFNDRNMIFSNAGTASDGIDVIYSIKVEDIPQWLFKSKNPSYISPKIKSETFLDTINPEITSHSPENGSEIFNNQLLKTHVADNFNIATIKYEYKAINEDTWNLLYEVNPDQKEYDVNYNWDLSDLETNTYELKITAIDKGGLKSEEYIVQYHNTKYELPVKVSTIAKECKYDSISLSWEYEGVQKFFKQFNIYRKKSGDAEFSLIKTTTETEYSDAVERGAYIYKIEVVDILGNKSISEELEAATYENDTIAPSIALSFNELAGIGKNILFDASASTDDDAIKSYLWDFGNGDTSTEMVCNYSYKTAGEYVVTLTVTDYAGNAAETKKSVSVIVTTIDSGYRMVEFDFTNIKENKKISNASIYIREDGDIEQNEMHFETDAEGKLCIPLKVDTGYNILITDKILGVKECSAFVNGYSPSEIDKGLVVMQSIPFAFNRSKNLKGTLTSHEMSLEEIIDAGIDLEDEDNYNCTEFKVTFTYGTEKVNYTYYKNSSGKVYHSGSSGGSSGGSISGGSSGSSGTKIYYGGAYKDTTYFVVISGETKWLKQMFDVSIILFNESEFEWIENCTAELILPEGLSLVNKSENQSGKIGPMETAEGHWFVRGDKAGEYDVSAIVKGVYYPQPAEPFTMTFESKEPIVVQETTECLELNLYDVPTIVKSGQTIQFDLEAKNISNITLNKFSIKLNNCEQFSISDENGKVVYSNETIDQGLELEKLLPGETARFTATVQVNFPDASGEQVKYYLKNYFIDSPFKVNVHLKRIDYICMEKKEYSVTEEDTVRIYATLDSVENTCEDAVWTTNDSSIAVVESSGYTDNGDGTYKLWAVIEGVALGDTYVQVKVGEISDTCSIKVGEEDEKSCRYIVQDEETDEPISGASITVNGITKTTGTDGSATFSKKDFNNNIYVSTEVTAENYIDKSYMTAVYEEGTTYVEMKKKTGEITIVDAQLSFSSGKVRNLLDAKTNVAFIEDVSYPASISVNVDWGNYSEGKLIFIAEKSKTEEEFTGSMSKDFGMDYSVYEKFVIKAQTQDDSGNVIETDLALPISILQVNYNVIPPTNANVGMENIPLFEDISLTPMFDIETSKLRPTLENNVLTIEISEGGDGFKFLNKEKLPVSVFGKFQIPIDDLQNGEWSGTFGASMTFAKFFEKNHNTVVTIPMVPPIPVPVTAGIEAKGGLSASVTLSGKLNEPKFKGEVTPKLVVEVFGGIGGDLGKVEIKGGIYGEGAGNLTYEYSLNGGEFNPSLELSAGLKATAKIWEIGWEGAYELIKATLDKDGWHGTALGGSVQLFGLGEQPLYANLVGRNYLSQPTGFSANNNISLFSMETTNKNESLIYENIISVAESRICEIAGQKYIFFTIDDSDRQQQNGLKLMYTKLDNLGTWSEPVALEDDGTLDSSIEVSGNYIIWEDTNCVFESSNLTFEEIFSKTDITAAKVNDDGTISTYDLTSDSTYNFAPSIKATSTGAVAMWLSNSANDLFRTTGQNDIHYSIFDGNAWSEPDVIENIEGVGLTYLAVQEDKAYIFYEQDNSLHCYSINDKTDTIIGNNINQYTIDDSNEKIAIAYFGKNKELYYDGDMLDGLEVEKIDIDTSNVNLSENPKLISKGDATYLFWIGRNNGFNSLTGVRYQNGVWSEDIQFVTPDKNVREPSAVINDDGTFTFCYFAEDSIIKDGGIVETENCNLYTCTIVPSYNLAIDNESIIYDDAEFAESGVIKINHTVENVGELPISGYKVDILDGEEIVHTAEYIDVISAGEAQVCEAEFTYNNRSSLKDFIIKVTPLDVEDFDLSNNSATFSVGSKNIRIADTYITTENEKTYLNVLINNSGSVKTTAAELNIFKESETGGSVISATTNHMDANEFQLNKFDVSNLVETTKQLIVQINTDGDEYAYDNTAIIVLNSDAVVFGDVFNDGIINMRDAQRLYMYIVGSKRDLTEYELMAADVYRDGKVNVKDAQKLAQYLAGWPDVKLGE